MFSKKLRVFRGGLRAEILPLSRSQTMSLGNGVLAKRVVNGWRVAGPIGECVSGGVVKAVKHRLQVRARMASCIRLL